MEGEQQDTSDAGEQGVGVEGVGQDGEGGVGGQDGAAVSTSTVGGTTWRTGRRRRRG